mmetsp:Transcript_54915/g.152078  ORF Transcript_54915/g.152078 Transcript_54915/m.152078 type:complete len:257 (+) Transcript_54915:1-771(+)
MLRSARLIRVFRLFKISRYLSWLTVFLGTLTASAAPLAMITFVLAIGMVVFASAVYFLERGVWNPVLETYMVDGHETQFSSIPGAFWWTVVTMSTVGYGDVVPMTVGGRMLGVITCFSGVMILAIPISVISASFHTEYAKMERNLAIQEEIKSKTHAAKGDLVEIGKARGAKSMTGIEMATQDEINDIFMESIVSVLYSNSQTSIKRLKAAEKLNREELGTHLGHLVDDLRVDHDEYLRVVQQRAFQAGFMTNWFT